MHLTTGYPTLNWLNFWLYIYRLGTGPSYLVIIEIKQDELCVYRKASSRFQSCFLTLHYLTVWTSLPYFLWCCFCRAASDNCPWRISFLCLSISPSIRAKAWEPIKDKSTPKPSSSSSSWLSAMKILSAESYESRQQNWLWVLQEEWPWGNKNKAKTKTKTPSKIMILK